VCPEARNDGVLGLANVSVDLLELLPVGEFLPQLFDLFGDALVAHVLLPLLLREGRFGGCCIRDLLDKGRLAGLLGLIREGLAVFGKVLGFLLAQLLELGGQAFLILEFLLP
jgi:hypothetical protein